MIPEILFNNELIFDDYSNENKVHIRIKQRNGRKSITVIENLPIDLNLKLISQSLRKKLNCISSIITIDNNKIIQLSGDQRALVKKFLVDNNIVSDELVTIHGY